MSKISHYGNILVSLFRRNEITLEPKEAGALFAESLEISTPVLTRFPILSTGLAAPPG